MKIFILEDSVERIKLFQHKLINQTVTFCDNVETAKQILLKESFDIIFFDHDLDDRIMVNSNEANTGYQLAKWIAYDTDLKFDQVIIHSMNPIGAERIRREAISFSDNVHKIIFPILIKQLNF